jgi:uncharacterized alkaline shock family protein YloU
VTTTVPRKVTIPVPRPAATAATVPPPVDTDERGRTVIAERVLERVAAEAAAEIDGVGGPARRLLGVAVGGDEPDRRAKVTARITGDKATLDVQLSVVYPASVGRTTERTRSHLMRRVEDLTGLTVSRVDITVTELHGAPADTRRVE